MINLKNTFYVGKERQDIMIEFYLRKRNLTISRLSSVQKRHMTSVAKDHILIRHQPVNKITIIQIIGCNYFQLNSLNYLNIISYCIH